MPDVSKPLGRTMLDGLTGLVYDDPITLWGTVMAVGLTWILAAYAGLTGIWVGIVLFVLVWCAIGASLLRAAFVHRVARRVRF